MMERYISRQEELHVMNRGGIKLTPEAYAALAEVANESGKSIRQVASEIILQAIEEDLIVYDREEE